MKECQGCGAEIPLEQEICIYCGTKNQNNVTSIVDNQQRAVVPEHEKNTETHESISYLRFVSCSSASMTGYAVSYCSTPSPGRVVIPQEYNGKPVLEINQEAFLNNKQLHSLVLPETVEHIGKSAFQGCTALKTVEGGAGVLSLGESAFKGCINLEAVEQLRRPNVACEYSTFAGCYHLNIV